MTTQCDVHILETTFEALLWQSVSDGAEVMDVLTVNVWGRGPFVFAASAPASCDVVAVVCPASRGLRGAGRLPWALARLCTGVASGWERVFPRALALAFLGSGRLGRRGGGFGRSCSTTFERRLLVKLKSANGLRRLRGEASLSTATEQHGGAGKESTRRSQLLGRDVSTSWTHTHTGGGGGPAAPEFHNPLVTP